MKSWGTRILFLYLGFVALIATMVYLSMQQKTDLVAADYYAREIAYQGKLDQINRSRALSQPVQWKLENGKLHVRFPEEVEAPVSGTLVLYCPADAGKDIQKKFVTADHFAEIDLSSATAGRYEFQLDWQSGKQTYYDEGIIHLP